MTIIGLIKKPDADTVYDITCVKTEGQFLPTRNNQWPPVDLQKTKKSQAFSLPLEDEQIFPFREQKSYSAVKCLVWTTPNRCDAHLEFRQLRRYLNFCQRKVSIYINSLMLQKNHVKSKNLRANILKYLKLKTSNNIEIKEKGPSQTSISSNPFSLIELKRFTEYVDINSNQKFMQNNAQIDQCDNSEKPITMSTMSSWQSDKGISNLYDSQPCFTITECNDYYKSPEKVEVLVQQMLKFENIKGFFEITKFSYNNEITKLIGIKNQSTQTLSEGFDLFDYIVTTNWIDFTNKILELKINDEIKSIELAEFDLQVLKINGKVGSSNFSVHKNFYLDNNGLNLELTFVCKKQKLDGISEI